MSRARVEKLETPSNLTVKRLIMSRARVTTLDPSLITVNRMIMSRTRKETLESSSLLSVKG
jgi:hypothetical protein